VAFLIEEEEEGEGETKEEEQKRLWERQARMLCPRVLSCLSVACARVLCVARLLGDSHPKKGLGFKESVETLKA
jgi:hypothetical protein